jgi:shikimate kinase
MNCEAPSQGNILLIGFMGCGKSTVGRELQQRIGCPLVDMDHAIEQQAGKSVSRIFEQEGETAFRDYETKLLRNLAAHPGTRRVISTGGGVIGREENRRLLRELGFVVWLDAPVEDIIERTSRNAERPLLATEDPAARIRALMEIRRPLYEETAHLRINTRGLDFRELTCGILDSASYFFSQHA